MKFLLHCFSAVIPCECVCAPVFDTIISYRQEPRSPARVSESTGNFQNVFRHHIDWWRNKAPPPPALDAEDEREPTKYEVPLGLSLAPVCRLLSQLAKVKQSEAYLEIYLRVCAKTSGSVTWPYSERASVVVGALTPRWRSPWEHVACS